MAQKQPLIIRDKTHMRNWSRSMRSQSKLIAFVPTMGYLHQGHLSLITEAHKHANVVAVSIYVNSGQFSPNEDLSTYPSDFEGDVQKLLTIPGGVDVVFNPKDLYDYGESEGGDGGGGGGVVSCVEKSGLGHESWVRDEKLEKGLCGVSKPVFFRSVTTVVAKLFNIVEPDVAVFGKKDYQQRNVIQRMIMLQAGIDWTCEPGKLDCSPLLQGKPCYDPDNVVAHANYGFDTYYHQMGKSSEPCDFKGMATISTSDRILEEMTYSLTPLLRDKFPGANDFGSEVIPGATSIGMAFNF